MSIRAVMPVNRKAAVAADEAIYDLHKDDDRPNALYDNDGNRLKLSGNSDGDLQQEWLRLYAKKGGRVKEVIKKPTPPGTAFQDCAFAANPSRKACKDLLEKLKKEAAALADDGGDPIKNGSEVNRKITRAYAEMYQRRPDLHWAGAATFVSKQMGCNMRYADQLGHSSAMKERLGKLAGHDIQSLAVSTKKVLVRGNQAIFKDIYPQYRLYELSPRCAVARGDDLGLNPRMVRGFKEYEKGNKYDGMLAHADYEQNVVLQNQVMDNPDLAQDVRNFQEAQDANKERLTRWSWQSQPEQASFSRECVAPGGKDSTYYFQTPPGEFTDREGRWDMAVPVLDKYNELMEVHPQEMKQAIKDIGEDMNDNNLPTYQTSWYQLQ
jgi:hypothetical protein